MAVIRRLVHRVAHWLQVTALVPGSEIRDGRRIQGDRCVRCGKFVSWGD